ncbi:hypothetical protein MASR2M18_11230 [Ignavibacteria bacterium]|nr:hypothetical protein [Bacteroidota bacterium]MCZ2133344.1 hypothetical protein [Bacteroidota bacterium]
MMNKDEILNGCARSEYGIYGLLSQLFEYPQDEAYKSAIISIHEKLKSEIAETEESMKNFMDFVSESSISEMQELYMRSFDVQAITTLDIGYVLFGEDYKRGQLLVNLNKEHREANNICNTELADNLPNVLNLLSKMTNGTMRDDIASKLVIPAVVKMISEFAPQRIEKKDELYKKHLKTVIEFSAKYRDAYKDLLETLLLFLKRDFYYDADILTYFKVDKKADDAPAFLIDTKNAGESCGTSSGAPSNEYFKDFSESIEIEMVIESDDK